MIKKVKIKLEMEVDDEEVLNAFGDLK